MIAYAAAICFTLVYSIPAGVDSTHPDTVRDVFPSHSVCERQKMHIERYWFNGWSKDGKHQIKVKAHGIWCEPSTPHETETEAPCGR